MRKGRIEQSFYSAVKNVFAVVCLLVFSCFFRRRKDAVVGNRLNFVLAASR